MTGKTHTLDKTKTYATIHGGDDNSETQARFEQNRQLFDATGAHIGPSGGKSREVEPEAEVGLTSGKGNLAKGQVPKALLPLEEGGAGGGTTLSYPQTTTKGQEILDETASDEQATGKAAKKK